MYWGHMVIEIADGVSSADERQRLIFLMLNIICENLYD